MNVPFVQNATFTGVLSTRDYKTSREWAEAHTLIQSNSAGWNADVQTLSYAPSALQVSISNGNSVTLNNLVTKTQALAYSIAL